MSGKNLASFSLALTAQERASTKSCNICDPITTNSTPKTTTVSMVLMPI